MIEGLSNILLHGQYGQSTFDRQLAPGMPAPV
jgi:hypothetical protein